MSPLCSREFVFPFFFFLNSKTTEVPMSPLFLTLFFKRNFSHVEINRFVRCFWCLFFQSHAVFEYPTFVTQSFLLLSLLKELFFCFFFYQRKNKAKKKSNKESSKFFLQRKYFETLDEVSVGSKYKVTNDLKRLQHWWEEAELDTDDEMEE